MMRTVRNLFPTLIPLAIAAFAAGCSRDAYPARSAGTGTFESSVPSSAGQGGPGVGGSVHGSDDRAQLSGQGGPGVSAMNQGERGEGQRHPDNWQYGNLHPVESDRANPDRAGQGTTGSAGSADIGQMQQSGGAGQAQQGDAEGHAGTSSAGTMTGDVGQTQQGAGATGMAAGGTGAGAGGATLSEAQVCASLKEAKFEVADIPGGVRVLVSPRTNEGITALRSNVGQLISESGAPASNRAGAACPLFQVARQDLVATTMNETADGIEISFTSAGDHIARVRSQVHTFFHGTGGATR